ncbi:MAG: curli assembly protein CsgF [Candidatus Pacebacteria bacterium]|jgi:hypothetical protein|nr:curli assembly protein CsgF [Candidatus Paceibacterota bacterium]
MINRRNKIMLGIALAAGLLLIWSVAQASSLVFTFNSPSFSGIGQSSHYLTIENLEKSRKDALIAKAEAEERRLENELKNTAIEIFRRNLESMFYTGLASQIIDNIFGEDTDQQNDGQTIIGGYKVVWTSTDDPDDVVGVTVKITNTTTGEVLYEYGFPYQESE